MVKKIKNISFLLIVVVSRALCVEVADGETVTKMEFGSMLKIGIEEMYNLEYQAARSKFERAIEEEPDSPGGYVYLALNDIFRLITEGENKNILERIENTIARAKEKAEADSTKGAWNKFFGSNAYFLDACWSGRKKEYFKAIDGVKKGMEILEKIGTNDVTYADSQMLVGCYQYFVANTPWALRFFATLLIDITDRQEGLLKLEYSRRNATYNNTTSEMLLGLIYVWEGQIDQADMAINNLQKKYPKNLLIDNLKRELLMEQHKYNLATKVGEQALAKAVKQDSGLVADFHYDLAHLYIKRKELKKAQRHFLQSYDAAASKSQIKARAALQLGLLCNQQNKYCESRQWFRNAIALSDEQELVNANAKSYLREEHVEGGE